MFIFVQTFSETMFPATGTSTKFSGNLQYIQTSVYTDEWKTIQDTGPCRRALREI